MKCKKCHKVDSVWGNSNFFLILKKTTACEGQSFKVYASLNAIINHFPSGKILN